MDNRSFFARLAGGKKGAPPRTPQKEASERHANTKPVDAEQCPLDVYQTTDELVIKTLIAGIRPEDLAISVACDTLTIRGVRTDAENVQPQDYYYRECYFGPFSRSVILPENCLGDVVKATLKNGVLTIRIPKKKEGVITGEKN